MKKDAKIMTKEEVVAARESLGLTQAEMARKMGLSRAYYAKIECGMANVSIKANRAIKALSAGNDTNYAQPVDKPVENDTTQPESVGELVLAPVQVLETVQQNNEMIQNVEQTLGNVGETLGNVDETLSGLAKSLRVLEDFDKAVQRRVKEVIEERSRHIIAACNMHVTAQAQIIITALTAVITVLESGNASNSVAITLLERVRAQIAKLSGVPEETV